MGRHSRETLEDWAREVLPRALAYARSLLRDRDLAEDAVQDCFCRLLRHPEYDLLRDGVRLLFRSLSNRCINEASRRRVLASLDTGGPEDGPIPVADRLAALPDEKLLGEELAAALQRSLETLPALQRAAFELAALGQGKREIAEILQITESNAGVLVHRARLRLAEDLQPWLER